MIKDISISERKAYCRYWLAYNYGNGHHDVILWSDKFLALFDAWNEKNIDSYDCEGRAPYGIACNIYAF